MKDTMTVERVKEILQDHWQESDEHLSDLRLIASYRCPKGWMVVIHLWQEYDLLFTDEIGLLFEIDRLLSNTEFATKETARNIADVIGAKECKQ